MPKRRRGSQRARRPGRHHPFELLVERALAGIPSPCAEVLREVAIVIEDEPSRRQRIDNHLEDGETLYGLYEGVPRTEYQADYALVPNRISLFRIPLEADFPDPRDLEEQVRTTVIHEIAHHIGMDDDRLEMLGYD